MTKKVSIIIPVYNQEKYLDKCINSVIRQSYDDLECILVDDGSTDNSPEICDKYEKKDDRIKVFHQPNSGVSKARNVGLANAKGEWITFADSDDYLEQHAFQTYIDAAIKYQADVVRGGYFREYDDGHQEIISSATDMVFTDTCSFFSFMDDAICFNCFKYASSSSFIKLLFIINYYLFVKR